MKKRIVLALMAIGLTAALVTGCGNKTTTADAGTKDTAEAEDKKDEDQQPAAMEPEGTESTGDSIFLDDKGNLSTQHGFVPVEEITQTEDDIKKLIDDKHYNSYEEVIANLGKDELFTYVHLKGVNNPLLIVTDLTYDNGEGKLATIRAGLYGYEENNEVVQYAVLASEGTASPLAVSKDGIFQAGPHFIEKNTVDEKQGAWVCLGAASEVIDENGETSYYTSNLESTKEEAQELLQTLFEEYHAASVIDFGSGK